MNADAEVLLTTGGIEISGRLMEASNATLFGKVSLDGVSSDCVYKPIRGERPLWDFPDGTLAGREVATYLLSEASGWSLVPPTVFRDGPFGPGMCQLWIDSADVSSLLDIVPANAVPTGWRRVFEGYSPDGDEVVVAHADDERLRRLAVLDVVSNNADRKGGHLLISADDRLYGVDHGICWHTDNKLRTVLWGWAGDRIPEEAHEVLERLERELDGDLGEQLCEYVTVEEVLAARRRAGRLLRTGRFPSPKRDSRAIPWPPF
ncbi:SCO1664 family protein [Fodinicola feengrottensis]|uniref:SCO1664 family protein n=1 Tax=Fodinicola feengrottensis TaxID=435914 RepID=A0ABN2HUT7_9ACTN